MIKSSPLISILMNCFNGEKFLREAIESVISQTYENWELIFWDNQSTDSSAKIFLEYKDPRLKYFYAQKHTGLGDARIEAIKKVKGSWVGILDVDDIWLKKKLEYQVEVLNKFNDQESKLGIVYGKVIEINEAGVELGELAHSLYRDKELPSGMILKELLLNGNFIMSPSILFNKEAFIKIGGFPVGFLNASDYYITCAISSHYSVGVVNKYVAKYREHKNNLTLSQKVTAYEEQLLIFNKLNTSIDLTNIERKSRIRELKVMIAFMEIKYKNNFRKGLRIILSRGSFLLAIKLAFNHFITKRKQRKSVNENFESL